MIYRPGLVACHGTSGDFANDWLARLLRQCAAMKLRPEFGASQTDLTPVNYVSKYIVNKSLEKNTKVIYHLANQSHVPVNTVFEMFESFSECAWKVAAFHEWQEELKKGEYNHLAELQPLFTSLKFDEVEALLFPARKFEFVCSEFTCPNISFELLKPFFAKLMQ